MALLIGVWQQYVFGSLLFIVATFLILLVLVQRGRGGGLAGALGGMGGQSAFGTKAGDLFTRITMVAAGVWLVLCIVSIKVLNQGSVFGSGPDEASFTAPADPDEGGSGAAPGGGTGSGGQDN